MPLLQYVSKVPTSPPVYCTLAEMSELLKHTVPGTRLEKISLTLHLNDSAIRICPAPAHLVRLPEELANQHGASFSWRFSPGSGQ